MKVEKRFFIKMLFTPLRIKHHSSAIICSKLWNRQVSSGGDFRQSGSNRVKGCSFLIGFTLIGLFIITLMFNLSILAKQIEEGIEAPDFSLKDTEGREISLSDFRHNKVVLIDFFKSYSPTCIREINLLNRLNKRYQKRGFKILSIDIEESQKTVKSVIKRYNISYTVLLDEKGEVAREYNVRGFPYLIIIDREGKVRWDGYWLNRDAESLIDKLLRD